MYWNKLKVFAQVFVLVEIQFLQVGSVFSNSLSCMLTYAESCIKLYLEILLNWIKERISPMAMFSFLSPLGTSNNPVST